MYPQPQDPDKALRESATWRGLQRLQRFILVCVYGEFIGIRLVAECIMEGIKFCKRVKRRGSASRLTVADPCLVQHQHHGWEEAFATTYYHATVHTLTRVPFYSTCLWESSMLNFKYGTFHDKQKISGQEGKKTQGLVTASWPCRRQPAAQQAQR